MSEILQIPAELTKVTSMAHRSLRMVFDSQENLSDEQMSRIMSLHEKIGWMAFLPEERPIDTLDVVGLPPLEWDKDEKTPGQRLRAALFILWEQKGKKPDTFAEYYASAMERIINAVKEKLV